MKTRFAVLYAVAIALPAFAHDPSQHKSADAKDPDCAQMDKMDMDPKDSVMKAMREKCMAHMKEHDEKKIEDMKGHDAKTKPDPATAPKEMPDSMH